MSNLRNTQCDYLNYDGLEYYHRNLKNWLIEYINSKGGSDCDCSTKYGPTSDRPITELKIGYEYFDTDLGYIIYWDGTRWVDSDGNPADGLHIGTTEQRPTNIKFGFHYFNTDLNTFQVYNGSKWITLCNCTDEPITKNIHWDYISSYGQKLRESEIIHHNWINSNTKVITVIEDTYKWSHIN